MMMQNDNDDFQALLADYAQPTRDDGFSQAVMHSIDIIELQTAQARQTKLRLYSLYGAAFLGGIIASLQLPSLVNILSRAKLSSPNIESISADFNVIGIAFICAIALWAMLDSKTSNIF